MVEYSSIVSRFSRTVRTEYYVTDTKETIAAMEDDNDNNTSPEWIAHIESICQMENSMNLMENILATVMTVDGATCVLGEQLQYEVVSIQRIMMFLLDNFGSTADLTLNLPNWTKKELAVGIAEMLVPIQNRLANYIQNMEVSRKHLDFMRLQMVSYPNRVEHSNVDHTNYANFKVPMYFNGNCGIPENVVSSMSNDTHHGLDGVTSEDTSKKPASQCDYCGKENPKLQCCSHCKSVFYCRRTCQKNDYNRHKLVCQPKNTI